MYLGAVYLVSAAGCQRREGWSAFLCWPRADLSCRCRLMNQASCLWANISLGCSSFDVISSMHSVDKLGCPVLTAEAQIYAKKKTKKRPLVNYTCRSGYVYCVVCCISIHLSFSSLVFSLKVVSTLFCFFVFFPPARVNWCLIEYLERFVSILWPECLQEPYSWAVRRSHSGWITAILELRVVQKAQLNYLEQLPPQRLDCSGQGFSTTA